jgi:endonuclease III-like uncharacterized protein
MGKTKFSIEKRNLTSIIGLGAETIDSLNSA